LISALWRLSATRRFFAPLLTLVGLHVAAALYHWLVRRDRVLQRMLPGG
jgi:cytochrome b561